MSAYSDTLRDTSNNNVLNRPTDKGYKPGQSSKKSVSPDLTHIVVCPIRTIMQYAIKQIIDK